MWQINLYLAVNVRNNGKPNQQAGCAIIMEGTITDNDGNIQGTAKRTISQYLESRNQPQSELYGAIAALTTIRNRNRDTIVTLHTNSTYLIKTLTKDDTGEWPEATKNPALVAKLRDTYSWFTTPTTVFDNTSHTIKQAAELAKLAASDKSSSDSGSDITIAA